MTAKIAPGGETAKAKRGRTGSRSQTTTKATLRALERVFTAEINDWLPFQSKAAIFKRLCDDGLIEPMVRQFRDRFGTMNINGYQLTHAGRLLYCMSCDETEPD